MTHITIPIDKSWTLTAAVDDELNIDTQIALSGSDDVPVPHILPIAKSLAFPPDKIFKYLKKSIGQVISKGEVVAEKSGILSNKKYISEFAGTIVSVDHHKGEIVIEEHTNPDGQTKILAFVKGKITKIDDEKITIKIAAPLEIPIKTSIPARFGNKVLVTSSSQAILLTQPDVSSKLIIIPDVTEYIVAKLDALGAAYILSKTEMTSSQKDIVPSGDVDEYLKKLVEFAPKYVYAETGANKLTFY